MRFSLIVLTILLGTASIAAAQDDPIAYRIDPRIDDAGLTALTIEIRFIGDADGETVLLLPTEWGGATDLWRRIEQLEVDGAQIVENTPDRRHLIHAAGQPLTVRYHISASEQEPALGYAKAEPIVRPNWFFFKGEAVFAYIEGRNTAPVRFDWGTVPATWRVASDLDHLATGRPATVRNIIESTAIGASDLVVVERGPSEARFRLAIRGDWPFQPETLADQIAEVLAYQRRFWGDGPAPFVVTMAPLMGGGYSINGTGRGDGFAILGTPTASLDDLAHLLAHETLHSWIPGELGGLPEQDENLGYWFSEGFTDFYAARSLLASGAWTFADYIDHYNLVLDRYANSPARTAPNTDFQGDLWSRPEYQKAPYDRGNLLALLIDARLRDDPSGLSLDAILLRQRAQASDGQPGSAPDRFVRTAVAAGFNVVPIIDEHIEAGVEILLPADTFGRCATIETVTQPSFHRGFDLDATIEADNIVQGVRVDGPAYVAGLRDGMKIVRREGELRNAIDLPVVYRVRDGDQERVLTWLPLGASQVTLQRITSSPDLTPVQAEACATWLSGRSSDPII